jgi:peptidyl-prolyl cis-trans isomerase C
MKHPHVLLLLVLVSGACKNAPAPAPAAAGTTAAPAAGQPGQTGQPAAGPPGVPGQPPAPKPMPAAIPAVLALVNGEAIEKWEFESAVKRVEARAGSAVPAEKRDEVLRGVLDQLVAYHLLAQESKARKIDVTDKDIDAQLAQIRTGFPTEEAFKQSIAAEGLTMERLRVQARTSLQVQKVIDAEVTSKVAVQDTDVSAFYAQNLDRIKQGESVHASHILIGVPEGATPAQKAGARKQAQAVLTEIRGGGDFVKIAKENSQDPGSAPDGGDLGFFPKGQMTPAFEEAAFTLKIGAVSGLVETPFGFHIIKVHERKAARTPPLTEVSGQIRDFLAAQQREKMLEQFVEQAKSKGKIEYLV